MLKRMFVVGLLGVLAVTFCSYAVVTTPLGNTATFTAVATTTATITAHGITKASSKTHAASKAAAKATAKNGKADYTIISEDYTSKFGGYLCTLVIEY